MSFQVVKDLRRFADEESETLGRDVLRRQLHKFAERVDETIENITAHYSRRIAKQAGVMAETADRNVYLSSKLKVAEDALEKCVNYTNSWELDAAEENAKKAIAAIREEGGAK